jgi:hypothetical protein
MARVMLRSALALAFVSAVTSLVCASERRVALPSSPEVAIRVECPRGRVTRILLPEALLRLKGMGSARSALGLRVERLAPEATLIVEPQAHPVTGTIEFIGATLQVRIVLVSLAEGEPVDVRIVAATDAATEAPGPASTPHPATAVPPADEAAPNQTAPSSSAQAATSHESGLDLSGLLSAEAVPIDRREGLPGQPELRLVDALRGDRWVWLRLRLEGAAPNHVSRILLEDEPVTTFSQEPRGRDLWIVVQLARAQVGRRSRLAIETDTGLRYRIALRRPTLPGLLGDLFR